MDGFSATIRTSGRVIQTITKIEMQFHDATKEIRIVLYDCSTVTLSDPSIQAFLDTVAIEW